jgi:Fe-S cluster assembly iron-binding protein IscA
MKTRFLFIFFLALTVLPVVVLLLQTAIEHKTPSFLFADELPKSDITEEIEIELKKELKEAETAEPSASKPSTPKQKEPKTNTSKSDDEPVAIKYPIANNRKSPIGINANEIFEQDSSIPFLDLMRVATPFHENIRCRAKDQPCLTSAKVEYDKQGWPKKLNGGTAGVFFLRNVQLAALPSGEFTVLYDGEGKLEYLHNVEVISQKSGIDKISFTERADGFMTAALKIVESNPDKPLRNIRILMPGGICHNNPYQQVADESACKDDSTFLSFEKHYAKILFNPDYLNFMKDFSVIRFMPMSGVTRNPHTSWDKRPTMDEPTWGGIYGSRGAPLEVQVELANRLKTDPWLNVPHGADDDYISKFATYVKEHLDPELNPHIEYTNEAWNSNFVHNEYMQKMGIAEKLDQDALMAGYKYYAKRSVEFFDIWDDVYGGHEKLVRIIGGWDTRPDISGIILAYNDTYKSVDAVAIAPYIGGNIRGFRESKTVDDIFHLLSDKKSYRSLPKIMHELDKHAKLAKEFGISLIAYEGGQGLVDWAAKDYTKHPNPLFFAANRDPRMGELYQDLYSKWRELGAGLFVAFTAPRTCNANGCWGLKEHIRQDIDDAPKHKASLKFMEENERWWDWEKVKEAKKPSSSKVAHYLPKPDPNKPRIVIRPAKGDKKHFFRLENPQALNILLEGDKWDKRDISGKWQVKWDDENIYLIAKVYDKEASFDSDDPSQDDSVEFFISHKNNDFHFIYERISLNKTNKFDGVERTKEAEGVVLKGSKSIKLPYEIKSKFDGYEISATISWKQLGIKPAVKKKLRMDVIINDDDDGSDREVRLGWNTREVQPKAKDLGMILMSGR